MEPSKGTRARDDDGDGLGAAAPPSQQQGGHRLHPCDEKPSLTPLSPAQPLRASPSPSGAKGATSLVTSGEMPPEQMGPWSCRGQGQPRCLGWRVYTTALNWSCPGEAQRTHRHKQHQQNSHRPKHVQQNLLPLIQILRLYTHRARTQIPTAFASRSFFYSLRHKHMNLSPVKHRGAVQHHSVFLVSNPGPAQAGRAPWAMTCSQKLGLALALTLPQTDTLIIQVWGGSTLPTFHTSVTH